jgi:hypothetical protein
VGERWKSAVDWAVNQRAGAGLERVYFLQKVIQDERDEHLAGEAKYPMWN